VPHNKKPARAAGFFYRAQIHPRAWMEYKKSDCKQNPFSVLFIGAHQASDNQQQNGTRRPQFPSNPDRRFFVSTEKEGTPQVARRRFLTSTSASAAAAAAMLAGTGTASAAPTTARAPMNTPITDFLLPEHRKLLTPAAAKLSKKNLVDLRFFLKSKRGVPPLITVEDMNSIDTAFDSSELAAHAMLGYKLAGSSLGVNSAMADTSVTACCCCCPCCSTAAAVTRPAATI
jgi:pyruvate/2-oxoglutarate dehydrogenase complex dihydrolipoamide acyltransferase (E2) component